MKQNLLIPEMLHISCMMDQGLQNPYLNGNEWVIFIMFSLHTKYSYDFNRI